MSQDSHVPAPARARVRPPRRPIVLCVLDGWGHRDICENNAICLARTPVLDRLYASCPNALLDASEREVGLPPSQMGNSEVGHTNLGAGRIVTQDLPLMPGLEEDAQGRMVFDTAAGRIVEAYASGAVSRAQVLDFYAATLPQLGWRREGEAAFRREDEILVLEFSAGKAGSAPALTVRFALSPAQAGGSRRPEKP